MSARYALHSIMDKRSYKAGRPASLGSEPPQPSASEARLADGCAKLKLAAAVNGVGGGTCCCGAACGAASCVPVESQNRSVNQKTLAIRMGHRD